MCDDHSYDYYYHYKDHLQPNNDSKHARRKEKRLNVKAVNHGRILRMKG